MSGVQNKQGVFEMRTYEIAGVRRSRKVLKFSVFEVIKAVKYILGGF